MTASKYQIGDRVEITKANEEFVGKTAFVKGLSKKGWLQLETEKDPSRKITLSPDQVKICPLDESTSEQTPNEKVDLNVVASEEEEKPQNIPTTTHDSTEIKLLLPPDEAKGVQRSATSPYFKFTCKSGDLSAALSRVVRIIKVIPIHPVLANIKICVTRDGNVELTAFDLRMGVITDFVAKVNREGTFTLDGRILHSLLLLLPDSEVTLEVMEDKYPIVEITTSVGTYSLSGISADEFPAIAFPGDNAQRLTLSAKQLAIGLGGTLYATTTDETKQVLTGVHFVFSGTTTNLEMASTDGHRLARFRYSPTPAAADAFQDRFTIPGSTLREVERLLSKDTEDVFISYDSIAENNVSSTIVKFVVGNTTVVSRILEGQYPR